MARLWWKSKEDLTSLLKPLTPDYIETEHGFYVTELNAALGDPRIRNIALSGNYGVGKSSILKKLAELHPKDVLELSLSTLAPIEPSDSDDGLPKQATTPTNQIQQEIVKQLLYRERPKKTPGSRFRRIERFDWAREIFLALIIGAAFATTFLLTGWTSKILLTLPNLHVTAPWQHMSVFGVGFALALFLRRIFYGRLNIKQVSAGAATVTLDEKSVSYFDQYLDEIVYFFEVSKRKIVIFEDIDRFNDSHIFETLRSLNSLLHASPQIKGPIRFIYAIKDSIFDRAAIQRQGRKFDGDIDAGDDPAQAEVIRSNRTKFFDLVIPVVPFITHQSARNLTTKLLRDVTHSIDAELIDLASRFVPDMRLLKNVRNEFLVFRDRILSGDGENLRLSQSELFAMMLYKNTHLADFEAIRVGKSKIDVLYDRSREMVAANLRRIDGELLSLQRKLKESSVIAERSAQMGERLIAHAKLVASAYEVDYTRGAYSFEGNALHEGDLKAEEFWVELIEASLDSELHLTVRGHYPGHPVHRLKFSKSDLQRLIGPLDPESWRRVDSEKNREAQATKRDELKFIRSADIQDLMARVDLPVDGTTEGETLALAAQSLFGKGLAYHLLRSGYINRNFTLYTATFHGERVSPVATNFIIHHIERDSRDENFQLTGADVESIIREYPNQLGEPALYNIDILDYVLQTPKHEPAAETMVTSLARLGKEQKEFLQAYLNRGSQQKELIKRMVPLAQHILTYLTKDVQLDDPTRVDLFSTALSHLSPSNHYFVDNVVTGFMASNYQELEVLTSDESDVSTLETIADLASSAGIKVPTLRPLSKNAKDAFIAKNLYEINVTNLRVAVGDEPSLALDVMREARRKVYNYAREHLGAYLSSVEGSSPSVLHQEFFASILSDVASADVAITDRMLRQASEACIVSDLTEAPSVLWSTLARNQRFKANFANISIYMKEFDVVDEALAKALRRPEAIADSVSAEHEEKIGIASALLAARTVLSSSERAKLCSSLKLTHYLNPSVVEPEEGDLFAALLREGNVVQDSEATYDRLAELSWSTKELYICASKEFPNYVTPELIGDDLAELLRSQVISPAVKDAIMADVTAYANTSDAQGLRQLGASAAQKGLKIDFDLVDRLAAGGLDARYTMKLLEPHLDELSGPQVLAVLRALGDDFAGITSVGKDRPKILNTPEVVPVLDFLVRHGVVNSYSVEGTFFRVNKKHK